VTAAGGTGAGEDDPADEVGVLEGDHLRDATAEREAEEDPRLLGIFIARGR
jgi:hypothetical protein